MSLAIDPEGVTAVLIGLTWYPVRDRSFELDAYEWRLGPITIGATAYGGTLPSVGFRFVNADTGKLVAGPLTSLLAVEGNSS
jgi:hypothetical protein